MTYPGRNPVLRLFLVGMQFNDMPWVEHSLTACTGQDAVLQHALVGTQFNDITVGTQFYDMPWSGRSFMTYPGWGN